MYLKGEFMLKTEVIKEHKKIKDLKYSIEHNKKVKVIGPEEACFSFVVSNIIQNINKKVLIITHDNSRIDDIYEDLIRVIDKQKVSIFPEIETLPHEKINPDYNILKERINVLNELQFNNNDNVVITSGISILRKLMPKSYFLKNSIKLDIDSSIDLNKISSKLIQLGYRREKMVEEPGQFSIRGGILDIYTLIYDNPIRIELFGDEVDSIRYFDVESQRSVENIDQISITPVNEIIFNKNEINSFLPRIKKDYKKQIKRLENTNNHKEANYLKELSQEYLDKLSELHYFEGYEQFLPYFYKEKLSTIFDYMGEDFYVIYDNSERVWQRLTSFQRDIKETTISLLEQGNVLPSYSNIFLTEDDFIDYDQSFNGLYFTDEIKDSPLNQIKTKIEFETSGVESFNGQFDLIKKRLKELKNNDYTVLLTLNTESKAKKLANFLEESGIENIYTKNINLNKINIFDESFSKGFILDDLKLAVYSEKEIIGKKQQRKRKISDFEEGVRISSVNELSKGDYVVHENHGIGKYLGVKTLKVQDNHQDYLLIKYKDTDKLYVPTEKIHLVQKYIGSDTNPPKLYKLGGNEWQKVKMRVQNSVKKMAIGLLELYAEREMTEGYSFSEDTEWQKEFEKDFPHELTPDQFKSIEDIKDDMESDTPMDRLLCGDVGYGKTEVAIRAAFKAAMDGKQTAVLVPTTILAQQHFKTFKDRIDQYPVKVAMLSRFRTKAQQKKTIKDMAKGKVDIVIGTHRLVSKDVVFNDLGLLVVDEEQRFGVAHKEKLKSLKSNVDVLTLTATPIPRTLHMSLIGVRDMSVIETPPKDRYPIRTYIREFDQSLIQDAIKKELSRNGQVYFVHNRVQDINKRAEFINKLVPEARIAVAHGQMSERKLENIMMDFYEGRYDVLVCTTIIENGLDISDVNTIIINRAEHMGLAQLYQLRGRVGRSNRIAYAYLLYEKDRILSEIANKRLKAIKEFTSLGSGFKIAMRDLEIRGAGNLLGAEQSGHIASVGFSLYCKLLESAIEDLKGNDKDVEDVEININIDAYIPENYISDSRQKIEMYKKLKKTNSEADIISLIDEFVDRYGDPPQSVMNLIELSRINLLAKKLRVKEILQKDAGYRIIFREDNNIDTDFIVKLLERHPKKLKIRNSKNPEIILKDKDLSLLKKVLTYLNEQMQSIGE
ncbi:MAG: transcription-repair coupling factor [Halanaerobiales bacterium]|nr:transcription-repair coupling factor [Halanaerobiales bacterium]